MTRNKVNETHEAMGNDVFWKAEGRREVGAVECQGFSLSDRGRPCVADDIGAHSLYDCTFIALYSTQCLEMAESSILTCK